MITVFGAQSCSSYGNSVRLSVRHLPVFCPDKWRYDSAVFSIWYDNSSSFWRGYVYPDIRSVCVCVCVHTCTGVSIAGESVATCTRVLSRSRHLTVSVLITRRGDLLPVITQLTRSHLAQAHVDSYTQSQRHCQLLSFIHSQIWFPTDFQEFPRDILTTSR